MDSRCHAGGVTDLVGRPCDPKTSEDGREVIVALGVEVGLQPDLSGVRVVLQKAKAYA